MSLPRPGLSTTKLKENMNTDEDVFSEYCSEDSGKFDKIFQNKRLVKLTAKGPLIITMHLMKQNKIVHSIK